MRIIFLDTETTGLGNPPEKDNDIIQIACIETLNGKITKKFNVYLRPDVKVSEKAYKIHGISNSFLKDKPKFEQILSSFEQFIGESPIVIHNAKFDIAFINQALNKCAIKKRKKVFFFDTLPFFRSVFPGGDNSLDGLIERFGVKKREKHDALEDCKILSQIYFSVIKNG